MSDSNPQVRRFDVGTRMSEAATYSGIIHLAGQVSSDASGDITAQTREVLGAIDALLERAGSDKRHILMAQIFLADISEFEGMNAAWDAWVAPGQAPPRATLEARLAKPQWKVEIVITAAVAAHGGTS